MRGKKGEPHLDPADLPRRRANKQRGHGTYANDRPPIVGTVGRDSGKVRLRMVEHTDKATLCAHVEQFTKDETVLIGERRKACDGFGRGLDVELDVAARATPS